MSTLTLLDGTARPLPGAPAEGAVVVIDVQRSFADPAHLTWLGPEQLAAVAAAVAGVARLVDVAREQGVPVVWLALEQDPAAPWGTSLWLRGVPDDAPWPAPDEPCVAGTPGAAWFGVEPAPGETVVTKTRYSGFVGTTLEAELHAAGATWFVAAGLTTECCVAATVWDGFQRGWRTVVAADATAAYDADVRTTTLDVLAQNVALVTSVDALADALAAARTGTAVPA